MVRSRAILPLELGPWPRPYDPHLQMTLLNERVAALWALHHLYHWCASPGLSSQGHSSSGEILFGVLGVTSGKPSSHLQSYPLQYVCTTWWGALRVEPRAPEYSGQMNSPGPSVTH